MDRRKFLKKSSTGALAAAFLPLLSFTKHKTISTDKYQVKDRFYRDEKYWWLSFTINSDILSGFENSSEVDKELLINGDELTNQTIKLQYKAKSLTEKMIDSKNLHFIVYRLQKNKMDNNSYNFAKNHLGEKIVLEIHDKCHAVLRNEEKNLTISFSYGEKSQSTADCFLTTACVFHKNLPDNCYELNTLRTLREKVMLPNPKYKALIEEYEIVAPKMLLNINTASNKGEVLDHIYSYLVLPSVSLVEAGKNEEAIEHYTRFVHEMKNLYL